MTKFLLGIAIVAFTSFIGFIFAKKYRQRKLFFVQLKEFNDRFLSEITYYRRPIGEFISKCVYKGEFDTFLRNYFYYLNDMQSDIEEISFDCCEFLTKEQKSVVSDYFQMLGKGDSSSQRAYYTAMKEPLTKLYLETDASYKKYGDLYVKLGFLCGLLILILII